MRIPITLALLGLLATSAQALPSDIKVLAQFDLGYAKCEARFPHMRGQRDKAYLALWKVKPDAQRRAELGSARKSNKYRKERELAQKAIGQDNSPEMEEKLSQQCQATWAEAQRNAPLAKP